MVPLGSCIVRGLHSSDLLRDEPESSDQDHGSTVFLEAFVADVNRRSGKRYATGEMIFHCKNCHIYSRLNMIIEKLISPKEDARRQLAKKKG
jgi:hypothetical protein